MLEQVYKPFVLPSFIDDKAYCNVCGDHDILPCFTVISPDAPPVAVILTIGVLDVVSNVVVATSQKLNRFPPVVFNLVHVLCS